MENNEAVEVLRKVKADLFVEEKELSNAINEALLALEKLDRLEKWLDERIKKDMDDEHCMCYFEALEEVREVLGK